MKTPTLWQIFSAFFSLGCHAFGGPAAHLVLFHQRFVIEKKWLNSTEYAQIIALTQLLPGPSSSQTGMAIGYLQQRYCGAIVAWLGFTLPSALCMILIAYSLQHWNFHFDPHFFNTLLIIVLAIVSFAFWQMLRSYCQNIAQYLVMSASCIGLVLLPYSWMQFLIILSAASIGWLFSSPISTDVQSTKPTAIQATSKTAYWWIYIFLMLFIALFVLQLIVPTLIFKAIYHFYSTGALVFGGGHVILPMLYQDFVTTDFISNAQFDFGYTFAQLMPGPLFTFASYLGALLPITPFKLLNGLIATLAIFLPSLLLIFGTLPYWAQLLNNAKVQSMVLLINAAVIGFLAAIILPMAQKGLQHWQDLLCLSIMLICLRYKISLFISIPLTCMIAFALHHSL